MGTKNTTATATKELPSYLNSAYQGLVGNASSTATTPYQAYTGGFTGDQSAAFQNIRGLAGSSDPQFGAASGVLSSSLTPTSENVGQYMSPYTNSVIESMMANMQEQNAQQQQGVVGNAIAKGAAGGNRVGVAQAELARQQKLADNQALSGLYNQNYAQALGAAQADKAAQLQAAGQYAGLGQTQMQTGLAQTAAQLGAGTQQQQFDYQQYLNELAYPYQQQSWLASIVGGLGPSAGGTTTETKPQGNIFSQLLGAGLGAASLFNRGGVVPHAAAGGVMPYANDNADWPSYGSMMGVMPYASNDNAVFKGYVPQPVAMGGGGDFPTISPDAQEYDPLAGNTGVLKKGAGNLKSWLSPQPQMRLGYNLASGGVVRGYADGGGPIGTRARADYRGLGGYGGVLPLPLREDADLTMPRRPRAPDLVGDSFGAVERMALERDAAAANRGLGAENDALIAQGPSGLVAQRAPQEVPALAYADVGFDPARTVPAASVERFDQPVGIVPANTGSVPGTGGTGIVPFTTGAQFMTDPMPEYSQNVGDAWSSLSQGKGLNLSPDMRQALLAAGMGMMSSKSPFALSGIGEGGLQGIAAWNERQGLERENAQARANMGYTGQQLALEAQKTAADIAKTGADIGLVEASTGATRYTFTPTPAGIQVTDALRPTEPKFVPWGGLLPDGTTANPADVGAYPELFSTEAPQVATDRRLMANQTVPQVMAQAEDVIQTAAGEARAAQATQQLLQEMEHNLAKLPENGWTSPGTDFAARVDWAKGVNTYLGVLGVQPWFDETQIAAGEDLNKLTTRLGFDLSRILGSGEAASVVQSGIAAVPGGANSKEGARRIIAGLEAANRRRIDLYHFVQNWAAKNSGSVLGAEEFFNSINPPELYALSSYVPTEAMDMLREDPSADAIREFNEAFGDGKDVSRYVLGGR